MEKIIRTKTVKCIILSNLIPSREKGHDNDQTILASAEAIESDKTTLEKGSINK
ncbi:MAG: hypothetical protein JRD47_05870 [Deltaproteobacteria bacterium]|nr:hypothetical protein [Deltaproteobacteria bacterium]MBW2266399.1 hypothetical protein [Deltaproteobacteria bacterium]MBW2601437.1 hypothetical protein [Deltaproteobacteria bacterium]